MNSYLATILLFSIFKVGYQAKQNITIGLIYQNYARSKAYDKSFKETIRNINTGQSISHIRNLSKRYTLVPIDCILPKGKFYPSDIMHCLCDVMIKNQVSVIVFVTAGEEFDDSTTSSQFFLHMTSQTGIPIIAWNADNSGFTFDKPPNSLRIIQMAPPIEHQIQAILALLKRYNWLKFGVVCSKMPGSKNFLEGVRNEINSLDDRAFKLELTYYVEIDEKLGASHIRQRLKALKESDARILLVYSTTARIRKIFEIADEMDLLSKDYLWIGTQSVKGSLSSAIKPLQHGMLSVNFHTVSNSMFPPLNDVLHQVIGLSPKLFATALARLNPPANLSLNSPANCSLFNQQNTTKWPLGQKIYELMRSSFLKGNPYYLKDGQDSFFYLFDKNGKLKNSYLTISNLRYQTTKSALESSYFWDKVGEFTNNQLQMSGIEWPGNQTKPPNGSPQGFHIRVVTLDEPPFLIVSELDTETGKCPGSQGGSVCNWGQENTTSLKCCTGFCVDLLNKLSEDIGFTYTMYKVEDEKWGIKTEHGWNGLIYDIINDKADLIVTALKMNSERAKEIDFSIPFLETGISIIVKIKNGALSTTAFLEPFEYSTWIMILFVGIHAAAFSIFIFEWLSPQSFNMLKYPPPNHRFSLCRAYWLVLANFFNASVSTNVPLSTISRLMSLVWAAFSLLFLAIFTANLAAFMITRVQFYQLSGIDDNRIINAYDQTPPFRYGTVENGNTHETMRRNWPNMHQYVRQNGFFRNNITAGLEAVRSEQLDAFIYDAVVLDYKASKDPKCEFTTVGKWSSMTAYSIGFQKNSLYIEKINQFILNYQQKGDLERLQNFWLAGSCSSETNSQAHTASDQLDVNNFLSAFLLLAAGVLVAILGLGLEYLYCWKLRNWIQRVDRGGWCALISMSMGKTLTFTEAIRRVHEWKVRRQSLSNAQLIGQPRLRRAQAPVKRQHPLLPKPQIISKL